MAYDNLDGEKPILRDYLAAERTHLANERTLLAYTRTALIVLVTSFTFTKLFEHDAFMRGISFALVPVALAIAAFGFRRFFQVRRRLTIFERDSASGAKP